MGANEIIIGAGRSVRIILRSWHDFHTYSDGSNTFFSLLSVATMGRM